MYIATLLTSPAQPALDRATVESLRNAWGGGDARWLCPGEAAEIALGDVPENLSYVWDALQARGVDLVVQPAAGRRKRVLMADMDSTMIRQECIDELADEAGVGPQVAAVTAAAMNGEIDFEAALVARVALLRGLPASVIASVLDRRITLMPGGGALVATMRANGARAVLVSGGFTSFTGPVAARLGFDAHRANLLILADGKLTGEVAQPILGRQAKLEALDEIVAGMGLARADVIAVGDGMNDLSMLAAAGTGVALHGKPALQAECRVRINHGDLTALLYLQGYAKEEFVNDHS